MKVYYALGRLFTPVVALAFYCYSFVTRTPRSRVVVYNEAGEMLLVEAWPETGKWSLPGGGMKHGETGEIAAARELHEETGLEVPPGDLTLCAKHVTHFYEERVYTATVRRADLPAVSPRLWEVRQMAWYPLSSMPLLTTAAKQTLSKVFTEL